MLKGMRPSKTASSRCPSSRCPYLGVSTTGKPSLEGTMEVAAPKMEADMSLPSMQGDVKTQDLSIQLPSLTLEAGVSSRCQSANDDGHKDSPLVCCG